MAKKSRPRKRSYQAGRSGLRFDVGNVTGEIDPLLEEAFLTTLEYEKISSHEAPSAFVIGRTGSGKSAAFKHLRLSNPERVIVLNPENLSIPYVSNSDVVTKLVSMGIRVEPFFKPLWERVFAAEIIHHRYKGKPEPARQEFKERLRSIFHKDPTKKRALALLDDLTTDFWCSTEERVQRTIETLKQQLESDRAFTGSVATNLGPVNASLGGEFAAGGTKEHSLEVAIEERDRVQNIVNQSELPKLKEVLDVIREQVLDSPQNFSYLIIDDLDRFWVDEAIRLTLLRCLFEAVVDMSTQVPNLKILVALRDNIFVQLDYGSQRSGIQEEKVEGMIIRLKWTENDLFNLLDKRVRVASSKRSIQPELTLESILPNANPRRDPVEFIMNLTLMRPRDAISFLNMALEVADGRQKLSWDNLNEAEKRYSDKRLDALRDEWKDPYFRIEAVLELFRNGPAVLDWPKLRQILDSIALELGISGSFEGTDWLQPLCQPILQTNFEGGCERYFKLVNLLFDIGFLGASNLTNENEPDQSGADHALYCYDARKPFSIGDMERVRTFVVHPAFRRALNLHLDWEQQ